MKDFSEFARTVVERTAQVNGHNPKDWEILASAKTITMPWAVPIAKSASDLLYSNPGTAPIMANYNRADRELGLAVWLERLMSGSPGNSFWAETCLVGYSHATVGVDNGVMLALATQIEDTFLTNALAAFEAPRVMDVYRAFKRVFEVAMAVMVNAYEHAIMTGVTQLGFNEKLLSRMRTVAIKKMVDDGRGSLPLLDWSDALSVNIVEVDNQHKVLIGLLNALHGSSASGKGSEALRKILADLTEYTKSHFDFEERLFADYGYPEQEQHKESHRKLTAQVVHFNDEFQSGRGRLSAELFMFLRSWLNGHIRGSDKLYAKFLNAKGVC